jgi:predicted Zn-dependent protease
VTYLKDGTTKDSDGLTGKYTIEIINNQSQIHVQLITINGNPFEVIYDIISVGDTKLVLSKVVSSGPPTQLFFTNK